MFLNPSLLDQQYYPYSNGSGKTIDSIFLPVPVDEGIKWKQRTEAKIFIHNAGHGGILGRNGTAQVIDAMKFVKSPIQLILRSQNHLKWGVDDPRVDIQIGNAPYDSLWDEGDVFLFPERFNGLSLPLQEARASGMLVMCGDRFPMNTWLPREPLIPVQGYNRTRINGRFNSFDDAIFSPETVAATIDEWYGRDISAISSSGAEWASQNSWKSLKPKYLEVLQKLVEGSL